MLKLLTFIEDQFYIAFSYVFALINSSLVTYLLIGSITSWLIFKVGEQIHKMTKLKRRKFPVIFLLHIIIEITLISFLAWFVIIHFHTYKAIH